MDINSKAMEEVFTKIKEKVNSEFAYLNLTTTKQNELFQNAITTYLGSKQININTLPKKLEKLLKNEYIKTIKELIPTDKSILNSFTTHFLSTHNDKTIEELLLSFARTISVINPNISYEECLYLTKENPLLVKNIKKLLYENKTLNRKKLDNLLETDLSFLLEPFCSNNNIDITDEIDSAINLDEYNTSYKKNKNDNYFSDDIIKDYFNNLPDKVLTAEEEKIYFTRIKNNDQYAKEYVIMHNQKLVVSIAKKYLNRGLPLMDLIQEGNIGLLSAIDRFDVTLGNKFSTFAIWWIRQAISRSISNYGRSVRLPVYMNDRLNKIKKAEDELGKELGRNPTMAELSERTNLTPKNINEAKMMAVETISYDVAVNSEDKDSNTLQDFIPDDNMQVEDNYIKEDLKRIMDKSLKSLSEKEQYILTERFGLKDGVPRSLQSVGESLNVTRERVRQIEVKALKRLSHLQSIKETKNYLDNPNVEEKKQKTTLFKRLAPIEKNTILEAIKYLEEEEITYLKSLYGEDLSLKYTSEDDELHKYLIDKLNIYARTFKMKAAFTPTRESLSSLLLLDKESISELLEKINKYDKNIVLTKYKDGFNNLGIILEKPIERYFSRIILPTLKNLNDNDSMIYVSIESLDEAFSYLNKKEQKNIRNTFPVPTTLESKYCLNKLKIKSDAPSYQKLLTYAYNIETTGNYNLDVETAPFISFTKAKTKEELLFHLKHLYKGELELLKEHFGKDFINDKKVKDIAFNRNKKIIRTILPKLNNDIVNFRRPLEKQFNQSPENIQEVLKYFDTENRNILEKFYYNKNIKRNLTEEDYEKIDKLLNIMAKMFKNLRQKGSISKTTMEEIYSINNSIKKPRFDTSKEHLEEILGTLSPEEQELFKRHHNIIKKPLTPKEEDEYKKIAERITRILLREKRVAKQNPSIEVLNEDKELLNKALSYFNSKDQVLLKEKFYLSHKHHFFDSLNPKDKERLNNILAPYFKSLLNYLKEGEIPTDFLNKIKTISPESLPRSEYTSKRNLVLSYFTREDANLLKTRFDYKENKLNLLDLTSEEKNHLLKISNLFLKAINKIEDGKLDENIINTIRYYTRKNNTLKLSDKKKRILKLLDEKDQELFYKHFSLDLKKVYPYRLTEEETKNYNKVLTKLNSTRTKSKAKPQIETLPFTKDELIKASNYFSDSDKYLLRAKYNVTKRYYLFNSLTSEEQERFNYQIIPLFKEVLENINDVDANLIDRIKKVSTSKTISDDKEVAKKVLNCFSKQDRKILTSSEESDNERVKKLFDTYNKAFTFYKENNYLSSSLINEIENISTARKLKFRTSKEVILQVVSTLPKEDQELFYKKNGRNLDENFSELTEEEKEKYKKISIKISSKIHLMKNKNNKKEKEEKVDLRKKPKKLRFKVDNNTLKEIVNSLSSEEQKIFYKRNGLNIDDIHPEYLTEEENIIYTKTCRKISNYLNSKKNNPNKEISLDNKDLSNIRKLYISLDDSLKYLLGMNNLNLLDNLFKNENISLSKDQEKDIYKALRLLLLVISDQPKVIRTNKTYVKSLTSYLNNHNF